MIGRIVIDDVRPRTPTGCYPAKAVVGEAVRVSADVFRDGHDLLGARVSWQVPGAKEWATAPMREVGNDRWEAVIEPTTVGAHQFTVEAWTDRYATWRHKLSAKMAAAQEVDVELEEGARMFEARADVAPRSSKRLLRQAATALRAEGSELEERIGPAFDPAAASLAGGPLSEHDITATKPISLWVDRRRALVGSWYELFPRSEGDLAGTAERLSRVAEMGFDVLYLPPIHPIGTTYRKGPNNSLDSSPDDPGSPWAIGGPEGGHTAIAPELGTFDDFAALVDRAAELGMEIALDYALQCSPDHPWVKEHPEWFHHRPDGSIAYAENPPKRYQDIYPVNFWPDDEADRAALWEECKGIIEFWVERGVRIFRVDNPHTKPMAFWAWLIPALQQEHPDVIFLAEAFTRPKVMARLAEVGFSQSYTYFTWRTQKWELTEYLSEIAHGLKADYMRPNFWPNTPDILSGPLRNGPAAAFKQRLVLAATMVPSYGIYSGYELCENEPASPGNEEYLNSEKYEIKQRYWAHPDSLAPFITLVNSVRRRHPAFEQLRNILFHPTTNEAVIAYSKHTADRSDVMLMVVNLDPYSSQECTLSLDLGALWLPWDDWYGAHDEITGQTFPWWGPNPYVRLDPAYEPAHVLHLIKAP